MSLELRWRMSRFQAFAPTLEATLTTPLLASDVGAHPTCALDSEQLIHGLHGQEFLSHRRSHRTLTKRQPSCQSGVERTPENFEVILFVEAPVLAPLASPQRDASSRKVHHLRIAIVSLKLRASTPGCARRAGFCTPRVFELGCWKLHHLAMSAAKAIVNQNPTAATRRWRSSLTNALPVRSSFQVES